MSDPATETELQPTRTAGASPVVADVVVIVGSVLLAGVLGALLWWQVTDLPQVTRAGGKTVVEPGDLARQVAVDGWFAVVALVGGLLSGLGVSAWRHRDPLLTVAVATLAAGAASYVMVHLGTLLGPDSPKEALAGKADGAHASMQLALQAPGVAWLWPVAVALGCLVQLWVWPDPEQDGHPTGTVR